MTSPLSFRNTIFISIIGHITVFSIFSLTLGKSIPRVDYTGVSFWGQFLHHSQVSQPELRGTGLTPAFDRVTQAGTRLMFPAMRDPAANLITGRENDWREKPPLTKTLDTEKPVFIEESKTLLFPSKRREPTIIFHPLLPYSFMLYFKDRQVAHVELMFRRVSNGLKNSIVIKRKISSGNLEVDLLTLRYIGRYLFIQQPNITVYNWQTVKIDLSAREQ